ncbi:MAG: Ig-like domain-containing protein [Patescibacteria group bacterium]
MLRRQNKKFLSYLFVILFLVSVFGLALFCFAPQVLAQGEQYESNVDQLILPGMGVKVGIVKTVVNIINVFLGLLGLIAVILIIYAGFIWMTSQGRAERVEKARKIIINAIIGLVIILLSYLIVRTVMSFVLGWAEGVVNPDPVAECTAGATRPAPACQRCSGSGLWIDVNNNSIDGCGGNLDDDFVINQIDTNNVDGNPADNVRLCSNVQTIFNNSINTASVDAVKGSDLKIVKVENGIEDQISQAGNWKNSGKYLNFKQTSLYAEDSEYKIYIPKSLKNNNGKMLSDCLASPNCSSSGTNFVWTFNTGKETDEQKPTVISTKPVDQEILVPLSPYVKIRFDEDIDATTVETDSVQVFDSGGNLVSSLTEFNITSRQVSFSFINDLNEFETYEIRVRGISDLCNNTMDNYEFSFTTGDQHTSVNSNYPKGTNICPDEKILFNFSTSMEGTTITFSLFDGVDRKKVVLMPGEITKSVPDFGELKMIDNDFTAYEFSPASLLEMNTAYHTYVETDKQIDQDGTYLEYDWTFETSTQESCSCSPYVSYLKPGKGGPGQCFTIFGRCFVGKDSYSSVPAYINFNNQPVAIQAGTWDNRSIVATAPNSLTMDGEDPRKVPISVTVRQSQSSKDVESNIKDFYVTTNEEATGPCLYALSPSSGKVNSKVTAKGTRFGTTPGEVVFSLAQVTTVAAGNWNITEIETTVPGLAQSGNVVVKDSASKVSNPIYFDVRSDYESEQFLNVINDSRCEMDGSSISVFPSPNPKRGASDVCKNAVISARFNKHLNPGSVNVQNIQIKACSIGSDEAEECTQAIAGGFSIFIHDTDEKAQGGFSFIPSSLDKDRFYEITLRRGILAEDGSTLRSDYSWYFKTVDSDNLCDLKYVGVSPPSYFSRTNGEQIPYTAKAFGDNCIEIAANSMSWTWDSSDPTIATISSSNNNMATTTVVGGETVGETMISATVLGKEDEGKLRYNPNSCAKNTDCLDYYRDGSYMCAGSTCDIATKRCKPVIHNLSPDEGPAGRWITVHGCYFESNKGTGKVTFGDKEASYPCDVSWDDTQIIVGVPTDAGDSVKVETAHQLLSNIQSFDVQNNCNGVVFSEGKYPGICSLTPDKQIENAPITLKGENLFLKVTGDQNNNENMDDCEKDDQNCDNDQTACEENFNYTEIGYASSGNPNCCGDDSLEQYLDESSGRFCTEDETPICCSTALARVKDGKCVNSCDSSAPIAHRLFINTTEVKEIDIWEQGGWGEQDKIKANVPDGITSGDVKVELLGCPSNSIYLSVIGESCDDGSVVNQCSATQSMCGRGLVCNSTTCVCEEPVVPEAEKISILDKQPTGENNCTNLSSSILFSQTIKAGSLNDNIKLWKANAKNTGECIVKQDEVSIKKKENWLSKIFNGFSKLIKTAFAQTNEYWCPVSFGLNSEKVKYGEESCTNQNESDCSRIKILPQGSFKVNSEYMVTVTGSVNGIEGIFGGVLNSNRSWTFSTTADAKVCKITKVEITPGTYTFTEPNISVPFVAKAMSGSQEIETTNDYAFEWEWSKKDNDSVIKIEDGTKSNEKEISASGLKNGRANVYATALIVDNSTTRDKWEKKVGSAAVTVFLCENPVKIKDDKTTSKYETMYCKDGTQLPDLTSTNGIDTPTTQSPLLAEKFLVFNDDSGDAIGIRVYKNTEKLSSDEWYNTKVPNPSTSLQKVEIDGYDAVRSGRTVYVTAANHIGSNVYYNMYIMSYNDGASNNVTNILSQLINNWQFNNNITDFDKRDALHNDVKRLYDLGDLVSYLEKYKTDNGFYPKIEAGSYVQYKTTSAWPSWNNELGKILKETLPDDPINAFVDCPTGYDQASCWHHVTRDFTCPDGSHIYQYRYNISDGSFELYANMEYKDANWSDTDFNVVDRVNNDSCTDLSITLPNIPGNKKIKDKIYVR